MTIQGADSAGSASLQINTGQTATTQSQAQKFTEARAEAKAGVNDGDESPGLGANVNKLA